MSLVLDEHRQYLADNPRLDAFASALRALVKTGDVVLDLASGTGILGLLACQAGAARVYAVEMDSIVELAREIARDNGYDGRITHIQELSTRASIPEPVDLIVTDGAGRFGIDAGLIETLGDARRRFLKPGGLVIPSSLSLWCAPVETRELRQQADFWKSQVHGLTFASAHRVALGTGYPRHFSTAELLAASARLATCDPSRETPLLSGRADFVVSRAATLDGVGGWFSADLAPGIRLTNAPDAPDRINRRNVFFPLREPVAVSPRDLVSVAMQIRPPSLVRWQVDVRSADDGRLRHSTDSSTFQGMLISREDLERTRPAFQPTLTPAGRARRTILELCDGVRPVLEIEHEVFRRHRELFGNASDAAAFVAEVVTRYTT